MGYFKVINIENPSEQTKTFLTMMELLQAKKVTLPNKYILIYFEQLPPEIAMKDNLRNEWTETDKSFDEIREIVLRYQSL